MSWELFLQGWGYLTNFLPSARTRTYICVYTIYILVYVSFSTPGTMIPQFFTNVKVLVERWIPRIFDAGHRSSNMKVINKWHAFLQNRNFLNGETDEQSLSNHIATPYLAYEGDEGMELSQRLIRALLLSDKAFYHKNTWNLEVTSMSITAHPC